MKRCPACGALGADEDAFCEADGARLVHEGASTAGARVAAPSTTAEPSCPACGAKGSDTGDGYCGECGHRLYAPPSTLPGAAPARVGDFTVTRGHGEGDLVVKDAAGHSFLLAFGDIEVILAEAEALRSLSTLGFPSVVMEGDVPALGHYVVLDADVDGSPLDRAALSYHGAVTVVRAIVDAASRVESGGFSWEPFLSDFALDSSGELRVLRLRGARRAPSGYRINMKTVLAGVGPAFVPTPLGSGTPSLVRLMLPRSNFTTPITETVEAARAELDRAEQVVAATRSGPLAELCDPGLRREHNEDATAIAEGELDGDPFHILVVCDGVSSSTHAELASTLAAKVARDSLAHFARSGDILREGSASAMAACIRAAHVAICTASIEYGDGPPPGTTIVAALVFRKKLTVGWVGDSRAYWVSDQGAELCTTDHSWVNEAVARGEVTESEAMLSPLAHALTRCLGPLESDTRAVQEVAPDVRTKALPGKGKLVLCTDGLWNYFPTAAAIAGLVHGAGEDADPARIARFLVCHALAQGGGDNVSVAVLEVT